MHNAYGFAELTTFLILTSFKSPIGAIDPTDIIYESIATVGEIRV